MRVNKPITTGDPLNLIGRLERALKLMSQPSKGKYRHSAVFSPTPALTRTKRARPTALTSQLEFPAGYTPPPLQTWSHRQRISLKESPHEHRPRASASWPSRVCAVRGARNVSSQDKMIPTPRDGSSGRHRGRRDGNGTQKRDGNPPPKPISTFNNGSGGEGGPGTVGGGVGERVEESAVPARVDSTGPAARR